MYIRAFREELEGILKVAIDPVTLMGMGAGAKIMASNILTRHGTRIPGVRRVIKRVGSEALGLGARQGAAGTPMLSRPTREFIAAMVDPHLVKAYEAGHAAGKTLGPQGLRQARSATAALQQQLAKRAPHMAEGTKTYADIISGARLAPTRADALFAPIGDVWQSVKGLRSSSSRMRQALKAESRLPANVRAPSEVLPTSESARRARVAGLKDLMVDSPVGLGVRV